MVILPATPALARRVALFEVFMVCGEDRDNPEVQHTCLLWAGVYGGQRREPGRAEVQACCRPACA